MSKEQQPRPPVVAQPIPQVARLVVAEPPLFVLPPVQRTPTALSMVDGYRGYYTEVSYCGPISCLVFWCFFWVGGFLVILCPLDRKLVFVREDGVLCLPV